jgi:hypothetical protein
VLAVVAAVLSSPFASGPDPAPLPPDAPVTVAPDPATAVAAAFRQGTKVEVASERTDTRTVFVHPDGTHSARISAVPTRFQRGGRWVDIDRTLARRTDGTVAPKAVGDDVALSGGGDGPLLRLTAGGRTLRMYWPGGLPAPELSGGSATYPEVFRGVDLVMRAEPQGYQQLLVIKTREAAGNPALARVGLAVRSTGLAVSVGKDGGLRAVDEAGTPVFVSSPSVMWDSGKPAPRSARVGAELAGGVLTLVPDKEFLADPATVYPVTVDPTTTPFYKAQWATVLSGKPTQTYWWRSADPQNPDWAQVGQCWNGNGDCAGIGEAQAYFQFDTGFLADKDVAWANFYTSVAHSPNCNTYTHVLHAFGGGIAGNITWNNRPGGWEVASFGAPPRPGCAGHTGVGIGVVPALNKTGATTFFLRAANGGDQNAWRKYLSGSTFLEVRWNRAPYAPAGLRTDPPIPAPCTWCGGVPFVADDQIRLIATLNDPDSDMLRPSWRVQVSGRPLWTNDPNDFKPSGVAHNWLVGLGGEHGRRVNWWVHGVDEFTGGDAAHGTGFEVDTQGVAVAPGVTSAAYPDDEDWHGGVGVPGVFRFSPGAACDPGTNANGVCDIDHYRYDWGDTPTPATKVDANALGGSASVSLAPPGDGPRILSVQSVDRAGNRSPVTKYRFLVRAGNGPFAQWSMEGNTRDTAFLGDRHGTPQGAVTYAPGAVGSSMVADGAPATYMSAPTTVDTSASFSVSAWVRLDRQAGNAVVAEQRGTKAAGFGLHYHAVNKTWVFVLPGADVDDQAQTSWYFVESPLPAAVGTWTHLAGTYDGATRQLTLYVDGEPAGTAVRQTPWHASGPVQVGRLFDGALDEVAMYDRVLSPAEVRAIVSRDNVQTGHWRFDEKQGSTAVNSAEGGADGVLQGGAAFTPDGAVNGAVELNGSTGYVSTSQPVVRTDRSFTVAAWVYADPFTGNSMTAVSQDGNRVSGFQLQYNATIKKWVFVRYKEDEDGLPSDAWVGISASQAPSAGVWTHLAGTFNAANRKLTIYVNGQYGGEGILPVAPWDARGPLTIGRAKFDGAPNTYWDGRIDDVRTYSRVLSPAELEGIVTRSDVPAMSWPMDGTAEDPKTGADGTPRGEPAWTAGQTSMSDPADLAVNLDGNNDFVQGPAVVDTTQSYAVSAWVRLGARKAGWQAIATQYGTSTPAFTMGYSGTDGSGGLANRWVFQINGPDRNDPVTTRVNSDQPVQTGVWTHLAAVYKAGSREAFLYVNGVQAGYAQLTAGQSTFNATRGFDVGRGMWNGAFGSLFTGAVDDVAVYSRPLFAEEVRVMAGRDPALVHHWRFDESGGTTAGDSIGQREVTLSGATRGPGRSGNALAFDGADDVASTTGVDLRTDKSFTVSAWVRLARPGPCASVCRQTAVSMDGGAASTSSKFRLGHRIDNDQAPDGKWVFEMPEQDGSITEAAISVEPSEFDGWVQLVGVYDAAAGQLWLHVFGSGGADIDDGTLLTPWQADGGALRVGRAQRGGQNTDHWKGSVDDVRLYALGLDADRLDALHRSYAASTASPELPVPDAGHWRFDEGSGTTAADVSGRDLTATLRGGAGWTSGRQGTTSWLNGTSGFADTAGPVLDTSGSFSISAWAFVNGQTGKHQIIAAQDGPQHSAMFLMYEQGIGRWSFEVPIPNQPSLVVRSSEPALTGLWTHVAATYDTDLDQVRLYVNGVVSTVQVGVVVPPSAGAFTIGRGMRNTTPTDFFSGGIDDVRVFGRRALTDGEVRRLHEDAPFVNHGTWPMEGALKDVSFRHLPTTGTGTLAYEPGVRGQALKLTGTGSAATSMAGANMMDSFTVSAWAKLTSTAADATVAGQDGARMSGFLLQYNADVGRWIFGAAKQDADDEQLVYAFSPQAPALHTWTHLTGVYDYAARELRLYVNGQLAGVRDNAPLWPGWGAFTIGRGLSNGVPADFFTGSIDEVRTDLGAVPDAEIAQRAGYPAPSGGQLARLVSPAGEHRTVSSKGGVDGAFDAIPAGYRFEGTLGRLLAEEAPETRRLYGCRSGTDAFTSTDAACGGATVLGALGWAYTAPQPGVPTIPVYRCTTGSERFDSRQANCEGVTQEELLGYVVAYAPLTRYGHSGDGEHTVTVYGTPPGYQREGTLGVLLLQSGVEGTTSLYSCADGIDQFPSTDPACEGATTGPSMGRLWTEPPPDAAARALYRCRMTTGERFVSVHEDCEGPANTLEKRLGYVLTAAPVRVPVQ